jgi:hypothetical protein
VWHGRGRSVRRHPARYQRGEATIHYRFHPYAGRTMPVIGCKLHGPTTVVIVHQPDGVSAHVPEWMIHAEAAQLCLRSPPRLPLTCLRELRDVLGVILTALESASDSIAGDTDAIANDATTDSLSAQPISTTHAAVGDVRTGSRRISPSATTPDAGSREGGGQRSRKGGRA